MNDKLNRKFAPLFVLLILVLVTLACGLGGGGEEPTDTPAPTKPPAAEPTSPPAEPTAPPAEESPTDYDTVFPLPDDVQNFSGDGGESDVSFQTSLSMDEAIEFYREALADLGLTEYDVLTSIQDDGFSLVFTSWPNGEDVVVQGVDFGETINVSIRLEEVVEAAVTTPPDVTLGEEVRSDMGGFAFQPIPDYIVEEAFGFASMEAPDADPELGPAVMMIGGTVEEGDEEGATAEDLYDEFVSDLEAGIEVSELQEVVVDGVSGLAVDIGGAVEGQEMAGRVAFVAVSPAQHFMMFGVAPLERWDGELEPLFDAVVASVSFFEPDLSFELPSEWEEGEEIRQWAASATASSEYSNPGWAAGQATGAPDTPECGDYTTAWASSDSDTVEWIELTYDTPVYPTEVNIIQTYNPNQVLFVDLLDTEGEYHGIYLGEPEEMDECPYTLSILVEDADYLAIGVKIVIDQSVLGTWNEIDAVELVGVSE
ncbi:MAG: hypothetical protein SWK90_10310 [Chloroflexota bacterium]|nr:hypothetical protein [Chloroflexota bacterium]